MSPWLKPDHRPLPVPVTRITRIAPDQYRASLWVFPEEHEDKKKKKRKEKNHDSVIKKKEGGMTVE